MMRFVLSEMWLGLRRNASMVTSVILVTFVSLTFVGGAILMQQQIQAMKGYWYDRAQVNVSFCNGVSDAASCAGGKATKEQIQAVESQLHGPVLSPYVKNVYFEDQNQAYQHFQEQFAGDPITNYVKADQLNDGFWVNMTDPSQSDVLIEQLKNQPGVAAVVDERQFLSGIFDFLNVASLTAVAIAAIMLIAAALLIATTIRLSAFSRRRELGIMRLVGASNRLIQAPFILEGVVAAVIGAILASGAVLAIQHFFVHDYLSTRFALTALVKFQDALLVVPILIVVGIVLAAVSAWIAINRYLRV